jgi:hypothetical protein
MSQLTRHLLRGNVLEKVAVDDLSQVTPVDNEIYILGGSNINTTASGNTVNANLDNSITIDSANIGNISISGNTFASTDTNGDIVWSPNGSGAVNFSYANANSGAVTDTIPDVDSTLPMTDGQLVIGSTGGIPTAANITAGTNITITNAPNSVTITATDGGGAGGGLLSWEELVYTGSEQLNYTMQPNTGYITNSSVATPQAQNYCPKKNFNLTVPADGDLTVGDMFWIVNKGVGSVAIRGGSQQTFCYTRYGANQDHYSAIFQNWTSVYYPTPAIDNTTRQNRKYIYLSSLLLLYVGEIRQVTQYGTNIYPSVFYVLNSVGNWTSSPTVSGCYST